jgi:uncharacterized membrane protein YidH (DUF202 family)
MTTLTVAGVVLIVLGVAALVCQSVWYQRRQTAAETGPALATADQQQTVHIPPMLDVAAVVAGVLMVITGKRKSG